MIIRTILFAMSFLIAPCALAQLKIDINRGTYQPLPIAIPTFQADTPRDRALGIDIIRVVQADLQGSGLFRTIPEAAFIEREIRINAAPSFADWRVIQAEVLAIGYIYADSEGRLSVQFRLFDVFGEQQLFAQRYVITSPQKWRQAGHMIADSVYTHLTGEDSYFNSKIAFIDETGPRLKRVRRLVVMDQDGANLEFITDGRTEVLTPQFSPTSQTLIYTALTPDRDNPLIERRQVFAYDLRSKRHQNIGEFTGMSFSARFSPNGQYIVMSLEENGNSDIYLMHLGTKRRQRLTYSSAIDTSPSFSPDGKRIVFNSDRGGSAQLYVMNADQTNAKCLSGSTSLACRISFGQGRYLTPVWSPRGDLIAFTKQLRGKFYIGVIRPDGTGERLITESYLDEGPTWSPNGRVIAFFREAAPGEEPKLCSIDLSGRNLRFLKTPSAASDPSWGPLLK